MKCPPDVVEVSVWRNGIYLDCKCKDTSAANSYSVRCDTELWKDLLAALKPVMDLGHNWTTDDGNYHVHLFEPDVFEELTKGIDHHDYPTDNFYDPFTPQEESQVSGGSLVSHVRPGDVPEGHGEGTESEP